jgi:Mlc titration factor MtfA (ptsG expression regulator)
MWDEVDGGDGFLAQPFPEDWEAYLVRNVAHFRLLNEGERAQLRLDVRVLVAEKYWEGCGGLRVTDEVKVTVAAQASLMLLGTKEDYFHRLRSVLVYPSAFLIPAGEWMDDYDGAVAATGQAVFRGPVILAWDAVRAEARDPSSGNNVVIHEFAHQLDFLDGCANGTPDLRNADQGRRWHEVMTAEYTRLRRATRMGRDTFLGVHAAQNETEFFAVASERFFTRPERLKHLHPALYEVLVEFYEVDPMEWFVREAGLADPAATPGRAPPRRPGF